MENYYQQYKESANVEIMAINMTDSEHQGIKGCSVLWMPMG